MATSVQCNPITSSRIPDLKMTRALRGDGHFAASLKQAERSRNESSSPQGPSGRVEASPVVLSVDGPITNATVVAVVARVIKGQVPRTIDDEAPNTEVDSGHPQAKTSRVDELGEMEEVANEKTEALEGEELSDPKIAVTYSAAGDAQALRCGSPSVTVLGAGDRFGLMDPSGTKAKVLVDTPEIDKEAMPKSGELVFQLSLESTNGLSPAGVGRALPLNGRETQTPDAALDPLEPSLALSNNQDELEADVAPAIEKLVAKPVTVAERMQAAEQEVSNRAPMQGLPAGPTPAQDLTSLVRGTTSVVSDHSLPHSATLQRAEIALPVAPQLPTPTILQRMDVVLRGADQVVRLDIRQSMGAIKVAVHSDDAVLALQLRDSLPELLNRLDDRGLQARVTSLGSQSQLPPPVRAENGNAAGKDSDGWAGDTSRRQQNEHRERNPQRAWRAATWKLHEE